MKQEELNALSYKIIGAAIEVHKTLGAGLLESIYETCLIEELRLNGIKVQLQFGLPIIYKGKRLNKNYVIDLLIEDVIIIELKCVDKLKLVHQVQLVSYLKLANKRLGFLMNFNVDKMINGIKRKVNNF